MSSVFSDQMEQDYYDERFMQDVAKLIGVSVANLVPDDYIAKTEDDPEGVLEWFYRMDKQDQQAMLRQMMALVMMKKAC